MKRTVTLDARLWMRVYRPIRESPNGWFRLRRVGGLRNQLWDQLSDQLGGMTRGHLAEYRSKTDEALNLLCVEESG